jgi:hypothetical protein
MSFLSMPIRRREFLRAGALSLPLAALAERLLADPYTRVPLQRAAGAPIRIRGRVTAAGRGVTGAGVSDGVRVVSADSDGRFELVSDASRRWVSVVPPAGYRLPASDTGTLRLHQPIRSDARGEARAEFQLVPAGGPQDEHAFLVLADPQTQDAYEMRRFHDETVPDVQATVRALDRPCFGVGCGDIMYDELALFPDYERAVKAMGIPVAQVVGNHDLDQGGRTDEASTETFARYFGPTRFSFNLGRMHYVVLDDVFWYGAGYFGYLDAEQLAWLEQDLTRVERGASVVVFLHIPVFSTNHLRRGQRTPGISVAVTNREALYRLLEPYRARIFSGHLHETEHTTEGGVPEHTVGAVCGAWWSGDICYDGTPNGYGVYEVRGDDLRWHYKATGKPVDHQLRLYPRGADPAAPEEVVANVWNWDPSWTVVWYEGADRRGALSRRTGLDPLSVQLHTGPDLPTRRPWVDPEPTRHLFYAPVPADARQTRVEATDRWGRKFSATLDA